MPEASRHLIGDRPARMPPEYGAIDDPRLRHLKAALARTIATEASWRMSCEMTGGRSWPEGYCVEASIGLRDELVETCPEADPVFVWGDFYAGVDDNRARIDHAWVQIGGPELAVICDVTIGQFFQRGHAPVPIVLPHFPVYQRYTARDFDPSWARD